MASSTLTPPLAGDALDRVQARLREPDWLRAVRLAAWSRYDSTPMPARTDERWRKTDLTRFDADRLRAPGQDGPSSRVEFDVGMTPPEESARRWAAARDELLGQGVLFGRFSDVVREYPDRFRRRLEGGMPGPGAAPESTIPADADKFELLSRAIGGEGYAIHVPKGVDVALPLRARVTAFEPFLAESAGSQGVDLAESLEAENPSAVVFPRSIVVAERGSRVTVVEEFGSERGIGPYCAAGLTEIFVEEGAEVTIVSIQQWSDRTWNFQTQRSHVAANGRIVTLTIQLGGATTKANVEGVLIGRDAASRMLGITFGSGKQHFDLYTLQAHDAGATTSDLLFKNALQDEAKSIYGGLIRVGEGVLGADAYQSNRNLLLSGHAKADSRPMLEILNNEVRCTHGASMGPVDQEQLFYLQARGLPRAEAERMVVQGFFEDAIDPVRDESVRTWIRKRIAAKIGGPADEEG